MDKRQWIIAVAASVLLNLALIFLGRGSFGAVLMPLGISLCIGLLLLLLATILYLIAVREKSGQVMSNAATTLAAALVIFSTLISIPFGRKVLEHDLRTAQNFCEELIPKLEEIRSKTGSYPKEIAGIVDGRSLPRLVDSRFYHSDGTSFEFVVLNPGTMMFGIVTYSSKFKRWHWD